MADRITLELQPRETLGKKVKRLRQEGIIPVHLYGPGISPKSLQCQGTTLVKAIKEAGGNIPIAVTVEGETEQHLAFVRELQWDPVKTVLLHVDLLRAEATQRVSADVPVMMVGDSPGARAVGGAVVQQRYTITIEALPLDMPQSLEVDMTSMTEANSVLRVGDIKLPLEATLLTEPDAMVARIEVARAEEVEEEVEGAAEGAEEAGAGETPGQR